MAGLSINTRTFEEGKYHSSDGGCLATVRRVLIDLASAEVSASVTYFFSCSSVASTAAV